MLLLANGSFADRIKNTPKLGTEELPANTPPTTYLQSFGMVDVDTEGELTVKLVDITGEILFQKSMQAE